MSPYSPYTDESPPLAPHALQTAVETMIARLLQEAWFGNSSRHLGLPALSRKQRDINKHFAREELQAILRHLTVADFPGDTDAELTHTHAIAAFCKRPHEARFAGEFKSPPSPSPSPSPPGD